MAIIDKTKSQTYNFLSENKSIEDIKKQPNTTLKEKSRHGGSTFKIIEKITASEQQLNDDLSKNINENLKIVSTNLTDNEKEQKTNNDFWTKLTNYLNLPKPNTEELIQAQRKIQELEKEIQQLKKEYEELKLKQGNVNLAKFKYNAITIYNEKQTKKTGIDKIHEEFLPIADKIFFITTFVHINQSISEEIMYFHHFKYDASLKIIKQTKYYKNINEYKSNIFLIDEQNQNLNKITAKDFLKKQQDFKLKPTKIERTLWYIFTVIVVLAGISTFIGVIILFFPTVASIPAVAIGLKVVGTLSSISFIRIFASIFSSATRKVDVWFGYKFYKNKEQKEKEKKERQSIIKNLSVDKLETKLQTQYEILKQELDNRKEKNPDQLINKNIINHNLNNISQNLNIESENNQNFDSSIRNTVNNQDSQPLTSSIKNWNKVKCLLT
ncbi:hypothetical protein [Spiroplasma endosymbiont of Melieria omissa]|uniref:hypothetical protein n=1 Tax=Spiroplasma endosymbiont of Melieria omissa TaxID=3139324 RepID=UPI003CCB24D9